MERYFLFSFRDKLDFTMIRNIKCWLVLKTNIEIKKWKDHDKHIVINVLKRFTMILTTPSDNMKEDCLSDFYQFFLKMRQEKSWNVLRWAVMIHRHLICVSGRFEKSWRNLLLLFNHSIIIKKLINSPFFASLTYFLK